MSAEHVVRDGTKVLILVTTDFRTPPRRTAVRAVAVGDHALARRRTVMPEGDEPMWDAQELGYLRPDKENVYWCRGWKGKSARVLLATVALENSR